LRVIKQGKRPEEHLMHGTCGQCKCEVECARGEATAQDDGRNGTDYYVRCPTCQYQIWLYDGKHPRG